MSDFVEPLRRWFHNYKDDSKAGFYGEGWVTVTREGMRWRVDFGYVREQRPWHTCYADPRAPDPPTLGYSRVPPRPTPPRFTPRFVDVPRASDTALAVAYMIANMSPPPPPPRHVVDMLNRMYDEFVHDELMKNEMRRNQ